MKKSRNYELMWVLFCVLMIGILIVGATLNAKKLCEKQEVFWINGTQYSCSVFK